MHIMHKDDGNTGYFYIEEDGKMMAEIVYTHIADNRLIIDHTEVDERLEGQGIGKELLAELVSYAREKNLKVIPSCSFAKAMLLGTKEWQDVLAPAT